MKCTKCNHILPDDSEFCQYCGSRIEKTVGMPQAAPVAAIPREDTAVVMPQVAPAAVTPKKDAVVMPEVAAAVLMVEAQAAREALASKGAMFPAGTEMPRQPEEKPAPVFENRIPDVPPTPKKAKKVKEPKRKYCSRCGAPIDPQSRQCTGCGKKYFKGIRINGFFVTVTVLSLVIAALIGLNVYQYLDSARIQEELKIGRLKVENTEMDNEILKQQKEDLEGQISDLKTQNHELRLTMSGNDQAMERYQAEINEYKPIVEFCKDHVEIVPNDGTNYYHKFSCNHLDMSNGFLVFNTEAAKGRGYTECPYCRYTQH